MITSDTPINRASIMKSPERASSSDREMETLIGRLGRVRRHCVYPTILTSEEDSEVEELVSKKGGRRAISCMASREEYYDRDEEPEVSDPAIGRRRKGRSVSFIRSSGQDSPPSKKTCRLSAQGGRSSRAVRRCIGEMPAGSVVHDDNSAGSLADGSLIISSERGSGNEDEDGGSISGDYERDVRNSEEFVGSMSLDLEQGPRNAGKEVGRVSGDLNQSPENELDSGSMSSVLEKGQVGETIPTGIRNRDVGRRNFVTEDEESEALASSSTTSDGHSTEQSVSDFLARINQAHKPILTERAVIRAPPGARNGYSRRHSRRDHDSGQELTLQDRWVNYFRALPLDFFTSAEAQMQETERVKKGASAYASLLVTQANCADIKFVYDHSYRQKELLGQSISVFDNMRYAVGQFLRFSVVVGVTEGSKLWMEGNGFKAVCKMELVQTFLNYFVVRSTAGTVMNKAIALYKFSEHAALFFDAKDPISRADANSVATYCSKMRSTYKTEQRHVRRQAQTLEDRIAVGRFLTLDDFGTMEKEASKTLDSIIASLTKEGTPALTVLKEMSICEQVIRKWCINFLGLLMFAGRGQRPQVYAQLQRPTVAEMNIAKSQGSKYGYFKLHIVREKRTRDLDPQCLAFSAKILRYVKHHVCVITPVALRKTPRQGTVSNSTLVFDTRNGGPLNTKQVSRSVRLFVQSVDGEQVNISGMSLRSCYATGMLQAFRAGKIQQQKTETKFIQDLAVTMNTSPEMLRSVYMAIDTDEILVIARRLERRLEDESYE